MDASLAGWTGSRTTRDAHLTHYHKVMCNCRTRSVRTATVSACATAKLSHRSWRAILRASPQRTTGTRARCSATASHCCASRKTPPTRCRTHLSSPPRSWAGCVTPSGCGPGSSPWPGTSACTGSSPGATGGALADLPEQPDESVDVGGEAERAESRALIRAAVAGLNDGERDVINQLWHGLEIPEVAMALGVSRNHAHSLFSRARDQLEASVAVLVVGRSGRQDCAALDQLLHGWDGRLTAPLRKRVGRHIDRCSVCSDRRRRRAASPRCCSRSLPARCSASPPPAAAVRGRRTAAWSGAGRAAGGGAAPRHRSRSARRRIPRGRWGRARARSISMVFRRPPHGWPPRAGADRAPAAERGRRDRGGGDRDRGGAGGRAACATRRAAGDGPATQARPARRATASAASRAATPGVRLAGRLGAVGAGGRPRAPGSGRRRRPGRPRRPASAGSTTSAPSDTAPAAPTTIATPAAPRPRPARARPRRASA